MLRGRRLSSKFNVSAVIIFFLIFSFLSAFMFLNMNAYFSTSPAMDSNPLSMSKSSSQYFTENRGQVSENIHYYSRGNPSLGFRNDGVIFVLTRNDENRVTNDLENPNNWLEPDATNQYFAKSVVYMVQFENANDVRPIGTERLSFNSNFFIGNDSDKWHTDVPNFKTIIYKNLYDGIDLIYRTGHQNIKYEFIVHPGADPNDIKLSYVGITSLEIEGGEIILHTSAGNVIDTAPYSYQGERNVDCNFVLKASFSYGFRCYEWNPSIPLVIDPLIYSTFLGGSEIPVGAEQAGGLDVDSLGRVYFTGVTLSVDFPTTFGSFDTECNASDVFVTKLKADGSDLEYSTFLGGSNYEMGLSISVDFLGNAYVSGYTGSHDFPTTHGAFNRTLKGFRDAFVTNLNAAGNKLIYSTFLGGSYRDEAFSIAVDVSGNAYVTGWTFSNDFPTTPGAFDTFFGGKTFLYYDAFVTKLNPNGTAIIYSTYLGGEGNESGKSIKVDITGDVYIVGYTGSIDFPTTSGAFNTSFNGYAWDGFVSKLDRTGSMLIYSTFLGGNMNDYAYSVAIDSTGSAYVVGETVSLNFPTTPGAFDIYWNGTWWNKRDSFVTKINPDGSDLSYSTFLGGDMDDIAESIAVDSKGNAYITGWTDSLDFPTTSGTLYENMSGYHDSFVTKLDPNGNFLINSTYLGGEFYEFAKSIAVDAVGDIYVGGETGSYDFPVTPGAFDEYINGRDDLFITKLRFGLSNNPPVIHSFNVTKASEAMSVFLTVAASDPDGDSLTYSFDFESDGIFDTSNFNGTATHIYGDDFNGMATIRVSDGQLFAETTANVIVSNLPPEIIDVECAVQYGIAEAWLRIAGEKWHDVQAILYKNGTEVNNITIVRYPGSPNKQEAFLGTIDYTANYTATVLYTPDDDPVNGQPNGATPAWIILRLDDGSEERIHHTFNVRHDDTWNWTIMNLQDYLAGRTVTCTATATDPGSDDLTFKWDWGDGSPPTITTHYNDAVGSDPYPSPGGTFPFTAMDSQSHSYTAAGRYDVKLRVSDDDGGVDETVVVIVLN